MKKIVLFVFCACNSGLVPPASSGNDNPPIIRTVAATSAQCPNGGSVIVFTSKNEISNVLVCDGVNGTNGAQGQTGATGAQGEQGIQGQAASLPVFTETEANEEQCPAGGTDLTVSSGGLSESVIICDGRNGQNGTNGTNGADGQNGADGSNGTNGVDGTNGTNGVGVVFTEVQATTDECPNGGYVLLLASDTAGTGKYCPLDANQLSSTICNGTNGTDGTNGVDGTNGTNGQNGQDGTNGVDGTNGTNASMTPFTIVNAIAPCGNSSSSYKEQLLCLADGSILADFSKDDAGDDTRLSFIPAGNYQDTDTSDCNFSVYSDGHGGLTVSWAAQHSWSAGSYDCTKTVSN